MRHLSGPRLPGSLAASCVVVVAASMLVWTISASSAAGSLPAPGSATQISTLVAESHLIKTLPSSLVPALSTVGQDGFENYYPTTGPYGCVTETQCVFGDIHSSKTVVLYGDSHAAMWLSALIPAVTSAHERLVLFWFPFCPVANLEVWNPLTKSPNVLCDTERSKFTQMIHAMKPSLVVLADRTSGLRSFTNMPFSNAAWKTGEIQTIKALKVTSTRVAVIGDISIFSSDVGMCLAASPSNVQKCSVHNPSPKSDQHFASEKAAAGSEKVPYINPEPWLCRTTCSPVVGNYVVFYDQTHVSVTYAAFLSGVFGKALKKLL
jgi:hypothetical protein